MNWKKITLILVTCIAIGLFVYDGVAIYFGGDEASISSLIVIISHKYPIITLLTGIVLGHFFWRKESNKDLINANIK